MSNKKLLAKEKKDTDEQEQEPTAVKAKSDLPICF